MNLIKKLGLLNTALLSIVIFLSAWLVWGWAQYYITTKIKPAFRENAAKTNTVEIKNTFEFKPQFEAKNWDTYTSDRDMPLLAVKYPPECFPVRTHAVGYCSFNKDQRVPTHEAVKYEVFDMGYSNYGSDFNEAAKYIIDQKTSSTDPWRLSDFEILEEGKVTVDGNEAYLLRLRGKPRGKDSYVYQNYLMFNVKYSNIEFPNRIYSWYLYNESNAPSQYFDTVVSTIHFTQKQK